MIATILLELLQKGLFNLNIILVFFFWRVNVVEVTFAPLLLTFPPLFYTHQVFKGDALVITSSILCHLKIPGFGAVLLRILLLGDR